MITVVCLHLWTMSSCCIRGRRFSCVSVNSFLNTTAVDVELAAALNLHRPKRIIKRNRGALVPGSKPPRDLCALAAVVIKTRLALTSCRTQPAHSKATFSVVSSAYSSLDVVCRLKPHFTASGLKQSDFWSLFVFNLLMQQQTRCSSLTCFFWGSS